MKQFAVVTHFGCRSDGVERAHFATVKRSAARCLGLLLSLGAALAAGCATQAPPPSKPAKLLFDTLPVTKLLPSDELDRINQQIPDEYRGDVIGAEVLGTIIYDHDRLATAAGKLVAPQGRSTLGYPPAGWLTERTPAGSLRVVFVVKTAGGLGIAAEVTQPAAGKKPLLRKLTPPRALTAAEQVMWNARQLAFKAHFTPCAKRYNPVVIPMQAGGNDFFFVYLLPVGDNPDLMFLGGYYRVTINVDGSGILDTHAFTRSCVTLERNRKATGAGVSELISPTPTPPQVYASLHYDFPLYVATAKNSVVWDVEGGHIYFVRQVAPGAGAPTPGPSP